MKNQNAFYQDDKVTFGRLVKRVFSFLVLFNFGSLGFTSSVGLAAKPAKPLRVVQGQGSFTGGQAGPGFSLLAVKSQKAKNGKFERVSFSVGDLQMKPKKGMPGYYHVELRNQQILIDFQQMPQSKVNAQQLQKLFAGSKYVSKATINQDKIDGTTNVVLQLKKPVKLSVLQVPGQKLSSQVVLQMIE